MKPTNPVIIRQIPDGSGTALFHAPPADTEVSRPTQAANGDVYFLANGELRRIGWRRPREPAQALSLPEGGTLLRATAAADRSLLLIHRAKDGTARAARLDAGGQSRDVSLPDLRGQHVRQLLEAVAAPRPQGHLSRVDPTKTYGTWLGIDVKSGGAESATTLRVLAQDHSPFPTDAPFAILGTTPLFEDGSFYVRVPTDMPLRLQLLDPDGKVVRRSTTPYWVRPNEVRGCTGCHDPDDHTPPNVSPLAAQVEPVDLRWKSTEGNR